MNTLFENYYKQYSHALNDEVMPFWLKYSGDESGAINNCLTEDGKVLSRDRYIWSQGRALWTYSAMYNRIEKKQEYLDRALEELKFFWADFYETDLEEYPYLEVKNARLIEIKEGQTGAFENVEYVVEFMLLTNYQSSEPYYANAGVYDMVVFYTDGTVEVTNNLFRIHSAATYDYDYTGIIESMEDLGPLGIQSLD